MALAWVPVVLAYYAPGGPSIRYWLFVAAHGLNVGGAFLTAIADALAKRRFSTARAGFALFTEFLFLVSGPIFMSAAAAAMRHDAGR